MNQTKLLITYFKLNEQERVERCLCNTFNSILKNRKPAVGYAHVALLNVDGTVSAYGDNSHGQCDTQNWQAVTKVAAGDFHTVALKSDGTVCATGDNTYGQCNVDDWRGVAELYADKGLTIGVTADGALLFSGQAVKAFGQNPKPNSFRQAVCNPEVVDDIPTEQILDPTLFPTDEKEFRVRYHQNGNVEITNYLGNSLTVVIPRKIDGKPVTKIGSGAFRNNQKLKSIVFPDSLKIIGSNAFQDCTSLETLVIPFGLTQICDYAFLRCKSLSCFRLPDSIRRIESWAFLRCEELEEVYIPDSLSFLGSGVFLGCYALKKVSISKQTKQRLQRFDSCFRNIDEVTFVDPSVAMSST